MMRNSKFTALDPHAENVSLWTINVEYCSSQDYDPGRSSVGAVRRSPGAMKVETEDLDRAMAGLLEGLRFYAPDAACRERLAITYFMRGLNSAQAQNYDHAIADFSEAHRLDPQNAEVRKYLAIAYNLRGAEHGGNYERSIADFSEALRFEPQDQNCQKNLAFAYYDRGIENWNKGDLTGAITDLSVAHQLDPQNAEFREHLAIAFSERGKKLSSEWQFDRAAADFSEAIRLGLADEDVRKRLDASNELSRGLRLIDQLHKEAIDKECENAIAESAVDARGWLSTNSTHPMITTYADYVERFYKALAVRVWFDEFWDGDESGEGTLFPLALIVELPQSDPEKQRLVDFFTEQLDRKDSVGIASAAPYVGERYGKFTIDENVVLDFVLNCKVKLETATLAASTLHVEIGVQNLAYEKIVGIVFTTDNWCTAQTAYGTHSSVDTDDREVWKAAATVGSATEVKFAVFYRVAGTEHWDNNFGRNYRVTPSRSQRFGSAP
jgi:tetratricopeptide (TPR) repeat protein